MSFVKRSNERLEFLGDAVLDMVITEELMQRFPEEAEGVLSKFRSMLVNEKTLAMVSLKIAIGGYLKLGKGKSRAMEEKSHPSFPIR